MGSQATPPPHVVIFPVPLQGPVNCMLKLAEILAHEAIKVTFVNGHHLHQRLLSCTDIQSHFSKYPNFCFKTIPDLQPHDNPITGDQVPNLIQSMETVVQPLLREMLASGSSGPDPVTCLIADGVLTFAVDVASQLGIPLLYFDTISPCGLWSLLCYPRLVQAGEVPFGDGMLDKMVKNTPGMEGIMRYRDLPIFCRINKEEDPTLQIQILMKQAKNYPAAQGLIFNTFQELEAPILSQMRTICSNVYAIGPLHAHFKTRVGAQTSNSIWEEDKSCISWLHNQPPKSVIYVSIGSLAVMTKQQLYEIWHGLVNSGSRFLWVRRPGSVSEPDDEIPWDLLQGTKERGYIVRWAPQEEVLAHPAVGGFLTHSGWNSTLESISYGKPMICWPFCHDQLVNSRYVEEVWKVGLDMKDRCDRVVVEKMIREVMEVRKDEFLMRAAAMAELAAASVSHGGSSFLDVDRLVEDIKTMNFPIKHI